MHLGKLHPFFQQPLLHLFWICISINLFCFKLHILHSLVRGEQYDQAVGLAEKYCDFRTLVEVCDRTENQERLGQYMTQFGSEVRRLKEEEV